MGDHVSNTISPLISHLRFADRVMQIVPASRYRSILHNEFFTVQKLVYLIMFLDWTHIFEWCVVQRGSKSEHHNNACLKEIGLHFQVLVNTPQSTVNTVGRTYVLDTSINKHPLPITITNAWEITFPIRFSRWFLILDLLIELCK